MPNKFTPGPWVAVELPTAIAIKSHMGNVANIQRGSMRDQQQANARLIAAAPDLLAAMNGLLAYFKSGNSVPVSQATIKANSPEVIAARAAIAKVQGGEA